MNPFETPPTTPLVSSDPPSGPPTTPRRGRMVLVALASAGLLAGGIVGVSALASADDPELGPEAAAVAAVDESEPTQPDDADEPSDAPDGDVADDDAVQDDDPFIGLEGVLDLDADQIAQLQECLGLPMLPLDELMADGALPFDFDAEFGQFDGELAAELEGLFDEFMMMFDEFDLDEMMPPDGAFGAGEVTVAGPDGVTVIDLGDGDASVTISRTGDSGELTITTDGTATQQSLEELFGEFGDFEELDLESLDELFGELPDLDELFGDFEEFDPESLDELFGEFGGFFEDGMFLESLDLDAVSDCLADLG